ncbi:MAG: hypothetical protein U1F43_13905 [Myxococcota bacterium]
MRLAAEFLDEHIYQHRGFSPSGDLTEFRLEFQETRKGDANQVVLVFAVPPDDDPEEPAADVQALAHRAATPLLPPIPGSARSSSSSVPELS